MNVVRHCPYDLLELCPSKLLNRVDVIPLGHLGLIATFCDLDHGVEAPSALVELIDSLRHVGWKVDGGGATYSM